MAKQLEVDAVDIEELDASSSMSQAATVRKQIVRVCPSLLVSSTFGLAGIGTAYGVSRITGVAPEDMTRDPTTVMEGAHFYIGALSNVGLLIWGAATGICLSASAFLWQDQRPNRSSQFLLWSGVLTLALMLDDALLLHERLLPWGLYIPERVVVIAYGLFFLGYLKCFFMDILDSDYLLLFLSCICFGISLGVDQVLPHFGLGTFIEDSFKFMGIVFWLTYFARAAHSAMQSATFKSRANERPSGR